MAAACGTTCDGTCGWCRLTAERDATKAAWESCRTRLLEREAEVARLKLKACPVEDAWCDLPASECGYPQEQKKLESKVARLREALEKYGVHQDFCGHFDNGAEHGMSSQMPGPCTCGYEAALKRQEGRP